MTKISFIKGLLCSLMIVLSSLVNGQDPLACNPTAAPGEICAGEQSQLNANASGGSGNYTYSWTSNPPGFLSDLQSPVVTPSYTTTYFVTVDDGYDIVQGSVSVSVNPSPQPDLGPDTLICMGASMTLSAGCEADFFTWSTGQFGVLSITVSDSGTYWVRGRFIDSGCEGYDTIHLGFHQPTTIDETNLIIIPTTCNGASGSITGITALGPPPFAYRWRDLSEVEYGSDIDVSGLPAGHYYLTITDSNGCETVSDFYTIEDAGNLQVLDVELTQPHCGRPDGQIIVHAFSPGGSALQYSIDDGATYQADSVFSGLLGAGYVIRVSDGNGCFGFYLDNPVILEDIPGPQVTQVNATDETDFLGNGSIEIFVTSSTPQVFFSIDNGYTWQSNNGIFNNLDAGIYVCVIKDENDCDTSFTIAIQNIILTFLHAITGEGGHCPGNTAMVPIKVDNFNSVAAFHMKLGYNNDNLQCEGFANVHPQLVDSLTGWVDQASGDIQLAWNSQAPVTFTGIEKVADLVFTTKNPGQGELSWYTGETESYFTNSAGNPIPAEFQNGEVNIYEPPGIILPVSKTVIVGEAVYIEGIAISNHPPVSYQWTYPNGQIHTATPYFASVTLADAGVYTLMATDAVGCTSQKSINLIVNNSSYGLIDNKASTMLIYPNPAIDVLNIQFKENDVNARLEIYDIQGKTMISEQIHQESTNINIGNLNPGVYIIRVEYNQNLVTRKLIVY